LNLHRCDSRRADGTAQGEDPKVEALRSQRSLNPRPDAVVDDEFASSEFFDPRDLVQVKYEMVRRVQLEGAPVASHGQGVRVLAAVVVRGRPGGGGRGVGGAGAGASRSAAGPQADREVVAFVEAQLAADTSLRPRELVEAIEDRFGITVHPRSIERALARARHSKSGGR
jgi:hypothetical protein